MEYNADSIEQLSFREGVRSRVGIYLGSADSSGVMAGLLELVNNSTDEALACDTAKRIEIVVGKDWASCRDYGRGMPHGPNKFSPEVMINLLTENHSGAKFNENAYGGKSRGLNGTGSAATCCSSDWFDISSYRDGAEWFMRFEEGIPMFPTCQKKPLGKNKQGTYIKYKPSQSVFKSEPINFDYNAVCETMKEYSYFNKGILFEVTNAETKEKREFISHNGLVDFAKEHIKNPVHATPIHYVSSENDIDVEIIMQWTKGKEKFFLFSNGGENPNGGTPITGIKTSITNFMKKHLKGEFDADMTRTGLVYICSVNLKNPIYDGQTKSKITNPELRGLCQRTVTESLNDFSLSRPDDFDKIIDFLTKERKAEQAAMRARQAILNSEKIADKAKKEKSVLAGKLVDCEKHGEDSILFITEGNSAAGSVINARDSKTMAVLPLRGKIINSLKASVEDVLDNGEVQDLITALGCGILDKCNPKKLRYGKIGIFVDGDVDGYSIMCLVLTFFYKFMPELITEGKIYWVKSPLFAVIEKNGKRHYAYDDQELKDILKNTRGDIKRAKGIGELSPEDIRNTVLDFDRSRITQLIVDDAEEASHLFELLMGSDVEPRKDYIFENLDFSEIYD